MSKILIIGGAGYIGSHVVLKFCESDKEVIVFDNLSTGHQKNIDPRADFIKGNILNLSELNNAFEKIKPDTVIHLAALKAAQEPKNIKVLNVEKTIIKDPILKNLYIDDMES